MDIQNAFGKTLKELRTKKQLSQERLSFESNLDRTYISLLERGLRQPSLNTIIQLANALDIEPHLFIKHVIENLG